MSNDEHKEAEGMDKQATSFEQRYPTITRWVKTHGWIEIGQDEYSRSFIRAVDGGGLAWEGKPSYETIDEALQALEIGIAEWMDYWGL